MPKCATGAPRESGHKIAKQKMCWHAPDALGRVHSGWVHQNRALCVLVGSEQQLTHHGLVGVKRETNWMHRERWTQWTVPETEHFTGVESNIVTNWQNAFTLLLFVVLRQQRLNLYESIGGRCTLYTHCTVYVTIFIYSDEIIHM